MKLHFPWPEVLKALEEIRTANTTRPFYGKDLGPGLLIVGDHGIYLMPNTTDGIHHQAGEKIIVYARECDPRTMPFDDWWRTKNNTWGGDDGCEFLNNADLMALSDTPIPSPLMISDLAISFTGQQMEISVEFARKH
ncbi:MAG: DUF3085 domain-containing protein [Hyphomicrobium sp.]|jgi:hypothetical protein|uniref:DUF3085 domain-containing protein n=1 Tax=Hyphomicrobium sp. TaxID=82 RepID=UPI0025C48AFC|nr:DUF3085 domain-containing protein [Hyphomicrobium sp.]MBX9865009.1 DUF3085 domain-containing protein [Hyphomicrobium sp.]